MISNRMIRNLWKIALVVSVILCLILDVDLVVLGVFTGASIVLFLVDLWKNYSGLYVKSNELKTIHAWNLIDNIGQIFFWSYLMFFIFVAESRSIVLWLILVDVFVVATYLNYKFGRMVVAK